MQCIRLGKSGLKVSRICLGMMSYGSKSTRAWCLDENEAEPIVRVGKARHIGTSSMYAWQFAKMQYIADVIGGTRFISMQNHYNPVYREEEREMTGRASTKASA